VIKITDMLPSIDLITPTYMLGKLGPLGDFPSERLISTLGSADRGISAKQIGNHDSSAVRVTGIGLTIDNLRNLKLEAGSSTRK
jgi:hypothetical protein